MTRPLVRAVFVVLVVATVAAFFTTQQLKDEFPLVIRFAAKPAHFSPNGDDYRDTTEVGFDLSEPASVTLPGRGLRGQRGAPHRERAPAGRRCEAQVPLGRARRRRQSRARRDLPDARRAARREPGDRLREGDHRGPQAAAGDAAVGGAVRGGHRPAGRDAERAAALPRSEEQGTRGPRVSHGRRQAAHRQALPRRARTAARCGTAR